MRALSIALAAFAFAATAGCDTPKPAVSTPSSGSTAGSPTTTMPPTATPSTTPTTSPTTTASTTPTAAPTTTPTGAAGQESQWVGSWTSASCGDRKYVRQISLMPDKTFRAEDRVSPCPPKVTCVWSGIVVWSGTWALNDKGALLTKTTSGKGGPGATALPEGPLQLVWDKAASAPAEQTAAGAACSYARVKDEAAK